jgi:hypothetical protein
MNPGHVFAVFDAQQGLQGEIAYRKKISPHATRFGRDWRELLTESLITRWRALSPGWKLAVMEGRMTGRCAISSFGALSRNLTYRTCGLWD